MTATPVPDLFAPLARGSLALANRIVMSPMTRHRAPGRIPGPLMATYYAQRASAGLVIAESTAVSLQGASWLASPGLYTDEQEQGWRQVVDAVHDRGGRIAVQLFHCGRCSCDTIHDAGDPPVAPSALRASGVIRPVPGLTPQPFMHPRALTAQELPGIAQQFADAARRALRAGFDAVEIHGANGFLIDQFLRDGANQRSDGYGGSIENRLRLPLEVVDAVAGVVGGARMGVHVSPTNGNLGMSDSNPQALYLRLARELGWRGVAWLHVVEGAPGNAPLTGHCDWQALRHAFEGLYIANHGYNLARAQAALANRQADLVSFGRPFISNPDLPRRLRDGLALAPIDASVAERTDAVGYTDYPTADGE